MIFHRVVASVHLVIKEEDATKPSVNQNARMQGNVPLQTTASVELGILEAIVKMVCLD